MKKALIIGAAFVDMLMNVPHLPKKGEDVTGKLQSQVIGGSAFNVYGAVKYAGQYADLFVPIGKGIYADLVKRAFYNNQIRTILQSTKADNGWDISFVEPDGERTFLTVQGIEQLWETDWFKRVDIKDYDYFYLSGYEMEDPKSAEVILTALKSRRPDAILLFDASPRISNISIKIIKALLTKNTMIHCNKDEINYLMPVGVDLAGQASRIYQKTNVPVIVTLGRQGSYYFNGTHSKVIPGMTITHLVNTVGAGDTHCGAIIAALMRGSNIRDAVVFANRLASMVVEQDSGSLIGRL